MQSQNVKLHGVSDAVLGTNWRHPRDSAPYAALVLRLPIFAPASHVFLCLAVEYAFSFLSHGAQGRASDAVSSLLRHWIAETSRTNPGRLSPRAAHTQELKGGRDFPLLPLTPRRLNMPRRTSGWRKFGAEQYSEVLARFQAEMVCDE